MNMKGGEGVVGVGGLAWRLARSHVNIRFVLRRRRRSPLVNSFKLWSCRFDYLMLATSTASARCYRS
jgi:hypothetical protein